MSTLGLDFGTTFCSASWINPKTGFPEAVTFPNAVDGCKIPSIVYFPPKGEPIVGFAPYIQIENASTQADREMIHRYAVTGIKRKMQQKGSFQGHSHVEIISLIIKHVVDEAKKACNFASPVDTLVMTHPVIFSEWQKGMLRQAAERAGFAPEKVSLLEEPVSAALAYIRSNKLDNIHGVMIYDFGGGTFDVAYVQIDHHGKLLMPLDPQGDPLCGGNDIDLLLYDNWDNRANQQIGRRISENPMEVDEAFLSRCRKQKELLSLPKIQGQKFSEWLPPFPGHEFEKMEWNIQLPEYNKLISPIIDRTMTKTQSVLGEILRKKLPLDIVLLIGGSSRIPQVRRRLSDLVGNDSIIRTTGQVDTAVAIGASYHAMGESPSPKPSEPTPPSATKLKSCFCVYCGEKISTSNKFCMFCGKENVLYTKP